MLKKFSGFLRSLIYGQQPNFTPKEVIINNETFFVRTMKNSDVSMVIELEKDVYAGFAPWSKSTFISEIYSPMIHLYLCVFKESELVAFIGSRVMSGDNHITNVAVKPSYQNKKIGGYLLAETEKFARSYHCQTMSLEVRASNQAAQRLYRRFGFDLAQVHVNYYTEDQEDALEMVKKIDD